MKKSDWLPGIIFIVIFVLVEGLIIWQMLTINRARTVLRNRTAITQYKKDQPTHYEIAAFCQQLSVTAGEDWGYKNCVDELEDAAKKDIPAQVL